MSVEPTGADIGRLVIYTGNTHPGGELEEGVITSFNESVVFVRYRGDLHSKATSPSDLEWAVKGGVVMSCDEPFWGPTFVLGVPSVPLASWVRALVDDVVPSLLSVGVELQHPDGRMVVVVSGSRWTEGGFSNWWTWREVCSDGVLGDEESGYGW